MLGLVGRQAHTGAAPLVPGQLEPWTALAGHAHFGRLLADVGAAVLFIHTVEALWDTERGREVHTMKLSYSGREASRTFRGSKFLWAASEKKTSTRIANAKVDSLQTTLPQQRAEQSLQAVK